MSQLSMQNNLLGLICTSSRTRRRKGVCKQQNYAMFTNWRQIYELLGHNSGPKKVLGQQQEVREETHQNATTRFLHANNWWRCALPCHYCGGSTLQSCRPIFEFASFLEISLSVSEKKRAIWWFTSDTILAMHVIPPNLIDLYMHKNVGMIHMNICIYCNLRIL